MEQGLKPIVGLLLTNLVKRNLILKGGIRMYKTGEKPGKSTYECTYCGTCIVLDDNTDTLPPCPKCHNTTYNKV